MKKWLVVFSAILISSGCVRLNSLNPNSGPERTLVDVNGGSFLAHVVWDAGAATEQDLPAAFLGGHIFTVPDGSPLGAHQVALERGSTRTGTLPFTVTAAQPFGAPRLDRVSIYYAEFDSGNVTTWLYIQAANGDVGADILINGAVEPSAAHKAIRNDLLGVPPGDLQFPIYHWVSYLAPWQGPAGSTIQLQVRNEDGAASATVNYVLPASAATIDSDGDDLPDVWEVNGYDADNNGTIDIDLPALGADPLRPDIFVEIDVMLGLNNPPVAAVWTGIEDTYAAAPIINPISDNGINMVIDRSGTTPAWDAIDFNLTDNVALSRADFYTLKTANFNNAVRGRIYHYAIWANARPNGSSGISDVSFATGQGGDDFIVSFDDFPASTQTVKSAVETFVHEIGHNFGQRHGGGDHWSKNPTYSSVMSYNWQLRTSTCCGNNTASRQLDAVYSPFYYLTNGAVEVAGAIPAIFSSGTDYSDGMGRNLNEACLNEPVGLYSGIAVDWNRDGDQIDVCGSRNMNGTGGATDVNTDFPNWPNLIYVGPRTNGQFGG